MEKQSRANAAQSQNDIQAVPRALPGREHTEGSDGVTAVAPLDFPQSQIGTRSPRYGDRIRVLSSAAESNSVPRRLVGVTGRVQSAEFVGIVTVVLGDSIERWHLRPDELEVIPEPDPTGEPVSPPRADLAVAPEEEASPPASSSGSSIEHVAYLRAAERIAVLERTLARVATDMQSIGAAVDATLADVNAEGTVLVSAPRLAALVDAATAVLADPTPDALSDLRRALAQRVVL